MQEIMKCPICSNILLKQNQSYKCLNNHCYDIAHTGYINLLPPSSKNHGDNKMMILARNNFLNKDYYAHLSNAINDIIRKKVCSFNYILDSGCGEGWYSNNLNKFLLENKITHNILGIDISKDAINIASKQNKNNKYIVASSFDLPFVSNSFSFVLNIFSPFAQEEFYRVLKDDGYLIQVIPNAKHLWQLKEIIYEKPIENDISIINTNLFSLEEKLNITNIIHLKNKEDINNLFQMTPYFYRTNNVDKEKLTKITALSIQTDFLINIFKKLPIKT